MGLSAGAKLGPYEVGGDSRALDRFESEARAVAALSHQNILAFFDVGERGGVRFAVRELLDEETIRAAQGRGRLPMRRGLGIAARAAESLDAAHEPGVVLGAMAYMWPEQAWGEVADFRGDQFPHDTVLYEMLAGTKPFRAASAPGTMAAVIRDEPDPRLARAA